MLGVGLPLMMLIAEGVSMPTTLIVVVWLSVTVYAVLGGADFGAGALDLFASARGADREREAIAKAIAPVWEANHVC